MNYVSLGIERGSLVLHLSKLMRLFQTVRQVLRIKVISFLIRLIN
jgi:hypothetical protein